MKKIILTIGLSLILVGCSSQTKNNEASTSSQTSESSLAKSTTQESTQESTKESEEAIMTYEAGSLLQAVSDDKIDLVKEILKDKTYDINEVNAKNETPLLVATHNNQIEIAKLLIDNGADVNKQDDISDSAYLYAGAQGKTEILAYMLENTQPNQQVYNRFGGNALIPAAEKGHLENVTLLLKDGKANIDHQNNYGYTALIEAVALRDGSKVYQDIVSELLAYGADKSLKDNSGKTAADYARDLGYKNMSKMLED